MMLVLLMLKIRQVFLPLLQQKKEKEKKEEGIR